jgi:hypothetical protein
MSSESGVNGPAMDWITKYEFDNASITLTLKSMWSTTSTAKERVKRGDWLRVREMGF